MTTEPRINAAAAGTRAAVRPGVRIIDMADGEDRRGVCVALCPANVAYRCDDRGNPNHGELLTCGWDDLAVEPERPDPSGVDAELRRQVLAAVADPRDGEDWPSKIRRLTAFAAAAMPSWVGLFDQTKGGAR